MGKVAGSVVRTHTWGIACPPRARTIPAAQEVPLVRLLTSGLLVAALAVSLPGAYAPRPPRIPGRGPVLRPAWARTPPRHRCAGAGPVVRKPAKGAKSVPASAPPEFASKVSNPKKVYTEP